MEPLNVYEVLRAYVQCALWSSTDDNDDTLDSNYSEDDLALETIFKMTEDVQKFVSANSHLFKTWKGKTSIEEQTGHDFWFTRNRHGVGFWEREWGEEGKELTESAHTFGEAYLYEHEGKIYQ